MKRLLLTLLVSTSITAQVLASDTPSAPEAAAAATTTEADDFQQDIALSLEGPAAPASTSPRVMTTKEIASLSMLRVEVDENGGNFFTGLGDGPLSNLSEYFTPAELGAFAASCKAGHRCQQAVRELMPPVVVDSIIGLTLENVARLNNSGRLISIQADIPKSCDGVDAFTDQIGNIALLKKLRKLRLTGIRLYPDEVEALRSALLTKPELRELNLSWIPLSTLGPRLISAFPRSSLLTILDLKGTELGEESIEGLAAAFSAMQELRYLDISNNHNLCAAGTRLVGAFGALRNLEHLDLVRTGVHAAAIKALIPALQGMKNLKEVSIREPRPDPEFSTAMAELRAALPPNVKIIS